MNYEFIERFIFEKEKNTPFRNKETFYKTIKEKYKVEGTRDLYIKIINAGLRRKYRLRRKDEEN